MADLPLSFHREPRSSSGFPRWMIVSAVIAILMTAACIERLMGRHPFCSCRKIHFWVNDANGPENSQQVADWYSFSHVIHGFLLYAAARFIGSRLSRRRSLSIGLWLVIAVMIEAGWELFRKLAIHHRALSQNDGRELRRGIAFSIPCPTSALPSLGFCWPGKERAAGMDHGDACAFDGAVGRGS